MELSNLNFNNGSGSNNESTSKISIMRCQTCGEKLKYEKGDTEVTCMACGNTYSISGNNGASSNDTSNFSAGGTIKIEGIKTSSSALAYIEQFLDSYDWESFAYDNDFVIDELNDVVENLKVTSADDYKTWMACFVVTVVPYVKKLEYRSKIYENIIEEYKKGNFDSYGMYDAYKIVSNALVDYFDLLNQTANKYLAYAVKYNIPKDEATKLEKLLKGLDIKELSSTLYDSINDIPEIVNFNLQEKKRLIAELAEDGINAEEKYNLAKSLIDEKKYVEALFILYALRGYKDSNDIINRINRLYSLNDEVIIVDNNLYFLKKDSESKKNLLFKTNFSEVDKEPLVNDIGSIITNYANTLYYFTSESTPHLKYINLDTGKSECFKSFAFDTKKYYIHKASGKAYFVEKTSNDKPVSSLVEADLKTNTLNPIIQKIKSVIQIVDNYVFYTIKVNKEDTDTNVKSSSEITRVRFLNSEEDYLLADTKISFVDIIDSKVIYTIDNPVEYNKSLMVYDLVTKGQLLLEGNITGECKVINDIIYYFTIDNLGLHYLITINVDGSNRCELSSYAKEVLFASGDWLYFIKAHKHNTALCKMKLDGTNIRTIASQIDEFVSIENGYLYYIDDDRNLHKVRMDGSKNRIICYAVESVLYITNNSIIYLAKDKKEIKSIYAIDFRKEGHRKVAYNVCAAELYDETKIFFIAKENVKNSDSSGYSSTNQKKFLYQLNLETYEEIKIMELNAVVKSDGGCYVATCVYNSYDCPQVWRLRRYRDNYLDCHWWGRLFIKIYYKFSPTVVKWFGKKNWFRKPVKHILDKKLTRLEKRGYSDQPYNDKY